MELRAPMTPPGAWDESADVVVVGFGMAAGALLTSLRERIGTARVLVLDRGEVWDPARFPAPTADDIASGAGLSIPKGSDHVELAAGDTTARLGKWWSAARAGGGALLWYGQLSRFRPSDFSMGSLGCRVRDTELRDWPLGYEDLLPAYRAVERALLPYGSPYGWSNDEYASLDCEFWRPRGHISDFEVRTLDALRSAGLQAYVGQTCLGGRAWEADPVHPDDARANGRAAGSGAVHPLLLRPNWYSSLLPRSPTASSCRPSPRPTGSNTTRSGPMSSCPGTGPTTSTPASRTRPSPTFQDTNLCHLLDARHLDEVHSRMS